jgi:hypothetical protein
MKRRRRPFRRVERRRRGVRKVAVSYRMLVIGLAAKTAGQPADISEAIDAAYEYVQGVHPFTASRMHPYEVAELPADAIKQAVQVSLRSLDFQRPAVLQHRRELTAIFEQQLDKQWGHAIDELRLLHEVAWEAGAAFHEAVSHGSGTGHDTLVRLHARALAVAAEIIGLLEHGQASGAIARWRTLHEISVIAAVIRAGDNDIARRYRDHSIVAQWRHVADYQQRADQLGFDPVPIPEVERIKNAYDETLSRYGKVFKSDYGWMNEPGSERRWTFRDLEELVGRGFLRPYYNLANQPVHAGARSVVWDLGSIDDDVFVSGPTNRGLTDPGQLTGVSLAAVTHALLTSNNSSWIRWRIYLDALDALAARTAATFARAGQDGDNDPGAARYFSASDADAQSLLTWPALLPEDYGELLQRTANLIQRRLRANRRPRRRRRQQRVGDRSNAGDP